MYVSIWKYYTRSWLNFISVNKMNRSFFDSNFLFLIVFDLSGVSSDVHCALGAWACIISIPTQRNDSKRQFKAEFFIKRGIWVKNIGAINMRTPYALTPCTKKSPPHVGAQKRAPEGRYASQVSEAHCWGLQMSLMALNYM